MNNSMVFLSCEIEGRQKNCNRKSLRLFTRRLHLSSIYSHDFSRWETLTSDIEGYKKSCDALRPPSEKEVGTTVLALSGVDDELWHQNRKL